MGWDGGEAVLGYQRPASRDGACALTGGGGQDSLNFGPEVPASSREFGTALFASHRRAPESLRGAIPSGCDLADSQSSPLEKQGSPAHE